MPLPLSKSQIERLGVRLVRDRSEASTEDREALHALLLAYDAILEESVTLVRERLDVAPTSRIKNTGTILEKLDRYGGSWLKSIQDIAGMRIVGTFDRAGQDALVAELVDVFAAQARRRRPKVVDRRKMPSHGYRAVHVIAFPHGAPVEIQVRTRWQHEWAELFEKLADQLGRGIRYGESPEHWLTPPKRRRLGTEAREVYDRTYAFGITMVTSTLKLAEFIDAVEAAECLAGEYPEVRTGRQQLEQAFDDLRELLDSLEAFQVATRSLA